MARALGDSRFVLEDISRDVFHLQITRCRSGDLQCDFMSQLAELLGAGNEIRFAVDFDHDAHASTTMGIQFHHALGCFPVGTLGGGGHAFFAQPVHSLLKIAIGFRKRLRQSRTPALVASRNSLIISVVISI